MSTDAVTRFISPETKAQRTLHFQSKDFQAAVKYRETDYDETKFHFTQDTKCIPCAPCFKKYFRDTEWTRNIENSNVMYEDSAVSKCCGCRFFPCGPKLDEGCCVSNTVYGGAVGDGCKVCQTPKWYNLYGSCCIPQVCKYLVMMPVFSLGACCSACRCGDEAAWSSSEVWCPSGNTRGGKGVDKARMAAGTVGDEITVETPGLEKEFCKTACCCWSHGCLHPKIMGCLGFALQQSSLVPFPCCCLAACCFHGSCTTMCKICTCEDLNSYIWTTQCNNKDCDCSGDHECPFCIFDDCLTASSCCCGLCKQGFKSKDGFCLCKETGICSNIYACGCVPVCPGCVERTNCPFCCSQTNDQKCMIALLGCVLYPACHHDLCKTQAERAALLNVDTRSWEERNPEEAAAAASSHLGSKKQGGGRASIGSSMTVMTQPGATTMNPAYDFGGPTEIGSTKKGSTKKGSTKSRPSHTERIAARKSTKKGSTKRAGSAGSAGSSVKKVPTEMRVDPTDGISYTKQEFVDLYGGMSEWNAAKKKSSTKKKKK